MLKEEEQGGRGRSRGRRRRNETMRRMEGAGREFKWRHGWRRSAQRGSDGEDEVGEEKEERRGREGRKRLMSRREDDEEDG